MLLITDFQDFIPNPRKPLVLGLGNFDGVHLGHQALIQRVIQKAKKIHGQAALFTFRNHPQSVLHPQKPLELLTTAEHKLFLFKHYGAPLCFWQTFNRRFSKIEAEDFVKKILFQKLKVSEICLGSSAHFGHNRKGNAAFMRLLSHRLGFKFEEIPPIQKGGDIVSSSRIRRLVKSGHLEEAKDCLGRPFSIFAKVIRGKGRGKKLGFPTANLETRNSVLPPGGVYPVKLRLIQRNQKPGKWLSGVLNYGIRPTFKKDGFKRVAEIFVLDFKGNLYGKTLEVVFYPKLRDEKRFAGPQVLKHQIGRDIAQAKKFFTKKGKLSILNQLKTT
ncbi:MAG: bifunctional riboflavin kinase/FAD synthetase [Candidatus Omnitrophica bacterium]|nr:bifunctional riboflavin kinase/FAD synthetase [Candidatus Omnitrophota bacterium]